MPTENDDLDNSWDNLADDLGIDEKPAAPVPEVTDSHDDADADDEFDGDDTGDAGDTEETTAPGHAEEGEGKKKRRRRRRRRKKGGAPAEGAAPVGEVATEPVANGDSGEFAAIADAEDDQIVEEGEAPDEINQNGDEDDENDVIHSAVDEEMTQAGKDQRQEWKVMSWADLIGKLYRPN